MKIPDGTPVQRLPQMLGVEPTYLAEVPAPYPFVWVGRDGWDILVPFDQNERDELANDGYLVKPLLRFRPQVRARGQRTAVVKYRTQGRTANIALVLRPVAH